MWRVAESRALRVGLVLVLVGLQLGVQARTADAALEVQEPYPVAGTRIPAGSRMRTAAMTADILANQNIDARILVAPTVLRVRELRLDGTIRQEGQVTFPASGNRTERASMPMSTILTGNFVELKVVSGEIEAGVMWGINTPNLGRLADRAVIGVIWPPAPVRVEAFELEGWRTLYKMPWPADYIAWWRHTKAPVSLRWQGFASITVVTGGHVVFEGEGVLVDGWRTTTISAASIAWRWSTVLTVMGNGETANAWDHIMRYSGEGPIGRIEHPQAGHALRDEAVVFQGTASRLQPGHLLRLRVTNSQQVAAVFEVPVVGGLWQLQVALPVETYTAELFVVMEGAVEQTLHAITVHRIAPLSALPPPTGIDAGLGEWLRHVVETVIFWLTWPLRAIATFVTRIAETVNVMVDTAGPLIRIVSLGFSGLPAWVVDPLTVAVPLMIILWILKR